MNFEERCREYIAELEIGSLVSYSHITLARLYRDFGKERVDAWVDEYFAKKG